MTAGQPPTRSFDISQEKDLIALLREVRHSALSPEEKDAVRDAVFSLSAKHNSIMLRGLKETLETVGLSVTAGNPVPLAARDVSGEPTPDQAASVATLGRARNKPRFGATADTYQNPPPMTPQPAAAPRVVAEAAMKPSESETSPAAATPAPTEVATPAPADRLSAQQAMDRIKEIKQKVNSAVGNPVNLINKDEVVGKAYMSTLLEAMRVATAEGDVSGVMAKLEVVYKDVQKVIAAPEPAEPAPEPAVVPPKEAAPTVSEPVPEVPAPSEPMMPPVHKPAPEVVPVPTPEPAEPTSAATDEVAAVLAAADAALMEAGASQSTEEAPVDTSVAGIPDPVSVPDSVPTPDPMPDASVSEVSEQAPQEKSLSSWETAAKGNAVPFKKIASPTTPAEPATTYFQSVTAQPSAIEKQRQVFEQFKQQQREHDINDPLHSEEVTKGLGMLLSEWELFRKSGLLGTGPKGIEHPLFKKMSQLKMNLIISGRFEGATPEVRQSIIDYMNGWRYEHGIVHEMDETFEHYLRRVIHTILKKQAEHA